MTNDNKKIGYWPSAQYLRDRVMPGSLKLGQKEIGTNNRSKGSDYIIQLADEKDKRPLWILAWGGANTLAQAIWQVQQERSADELKAFLNKLRVYTITDQDVPWGERDNHDFMFKCQRTYVCVHLNLCQLQKSQLFLQLFIYIFLHSQIFLVPLHIRIR